MHHPASEQWNHTSSSIPRSYIEAGSAVTHPTPEQRIRSSSDQRSYIEAVTDIPQTTAAMTSFASPPLQSEKEGKTHTDYPASTDRNTQTIEIVYSKMESFCPTTSAPLRFPNKSTMKQTFPWKKWFIGLSSVCGMLICVLLLIILKCYLILKRDISIPRSHALCPFLTNLFLSSNIARSI